MDHRPSVMTPSALALVMLLASCARPAQLEIRNAWTRDTVGGTANAAVAMTISSPVSDRLIGASSPAARRTDLMTMVGGSSAMGMKYLNGIDIPAGQPVSLNPGGLHVWLADLHHPLKAGTSFPLVLKFQQAGERRVTVAVIAPAALPPTQG